MADKTDDLVIGISTDTTTLRRQLRELGQSVTQSTSGVAKRFTDLGKQIDASMTPIQKRINSMVGIPVPTNIKEWTGALADVGKSVDDTTKSFKLNRVGMMELQASGVNAFQALASGMSGWRVAQMEGAQVIGAVIQGTEGGFKGLAGSAVGLATKFPLATAAIAAATVAVAAYATVGGNDIKSLDEILKAHEANIKRLGDAYDKVAGKEHKYASDTARTVGALNDTDVQDAKNLLTSQIKDIFDSVYKTVGAGGGNQGPLQRVLMSQFAPFKQALDDLANTQDIKAFRDEITSIAEVNPKLSKTRDVLLALTAAAADTAATIPTLAQPVNDFNDVLDEFSRKMSAVTSEPLQKALQDIFDKAADGKLSVSEINDEIAKLEQANPSFSGIIDAIGQIITQARGASQAVADIYAGRGAGAGSPNGRHINPIEIATDKAISDAQYRGAQYIPTPAPNREDLGAAYDKALKKTPHTPIPRRTADDRFSEDIAAITARTTALAQERGLLGATYEEQMRVNTAYDLTQKALREVREEARRKGDADWQNAKLTPEQIALINQKSEAYAQQADALKKARDAMQETADASRDFAQTFIDDMLTGKSAVEALGDALKQLGKRFEDLALNQIFGGGSSGSGLFGQLFGSLFGGGGGGQPPVVGGDPWLGWRANGGPVQAGMPYIVGEKRPELFVPSTSGTIIPRIPTIAPRASATPSRIPIEIHVRSDIDASGNIVPTIMAVSSGVADVRIAKYDRTLPGKVADLSKKPRMR